MVRKHCCDRMDYDLSQVCDLHPNRSDCPDALISFDQKSGCYGIYVHDGGSSSITINYCPWCGKSLAADQTD